MGPMRNTKKRNRVDHLNYHGWNLQSTFVYALCISLIKKKGIVFVAVVLLLAFMVVMKIINGISNKRKVKEYNFCHNLLK